MKSGLLSLALLGSPARGCFFRPEKDVSAPNALPGRMMIDSPDTLRGVDFDSPFAEVAAYVAEPMELSPREARVLGKRELRESCSKDEYFSECEQVNGSAKTLEQCLQRKAARSGVRLTRECGRGIEAWKQLLAETRPAANLALKKLKHEEAAREGPLKTDLGVSPYGLPKDIRDHLPSHHEKGHHHPPPPPPPHHPPHHGKGPKGPHPPPPPPPLPHHPPHHGKGPKGPHHGNGPHSHRPLSEKVIVLGPNGPRSHRVPAGGPPLLEEKPTMFSVLADWIFGDPSFGDSKEWREDPSSSDDGASFVFDAGFFPAGYALQQHLMEAFGPDVDFEFFPPAAGRQGWTDALEDLGRLEPRHPFFYQALSEDTAEEGSWSWAQHSNLRGGKKAPRHRNKLVAVEPIEDEDEVWSTITTWAEKGPGGRFGVPPFSRPATKRGGEFLEVNSDRDWVMHNQDHRRPGGDHIRFRNRLPDDLDLESRRGAAAGWLADSFDVDGDGPDLVEGILALFFFIGAFTLLLLPFFLLGRALKRLVRSGHDDDDDAPDGYRPLPDDAAAAAPAAAAALSAHDDGDSIVVTGTPVNPPPSVHL